MQLFVHMFANFCADVFNALKTTTRQRRLQLQHKQLQGIYAITLL